MKRINLTQKGMSKFCSMQSRYDVLLTLYGVNADDRMRFEYGHVVGELVDLAMGHNGMSVSNLIRSGLAEYDSDGRWAVDHTGCVINA